MEVEATATVLAKHIPEEAFSCWDHVPKDEEEIEVTVKLDYVPYAEEEGGAPDETLASGGYCERVWLAEGSLEDETYCLLHVLSKKEIQSLCDFAQTSFLEDKEWA